jgi:hypothetical protein
MHDNVTLRNLMTLPPIKHSDLTALTIPPELPPQKPVTGDKEVDAVIWLEEVVNTGNANHIKLALEAIGAIKTPMKELGSRYNTYMIKANQGNFLAGIRFIDFGDLSELANHAVKKLGRKNEALSRFGSDDALFAETPAEKFCTKALRGIKVEKDGVFLPQDECNQRFLKHNEMVPTTMSDCLYEIAFWEELYSLRSSIDSFEFSREVWARENFIYEYMLAHLPPRDRDEALSVLEHVLQQDSDKSANPEILRNLVCGTGK